MHKWIRKSWQQPVGATHITVTGHTLNGVFGAQKNATGWSLVWLSKNIRLATRPRLMDCKALGEKVIHMFDGNGDLPDGMLGELKRACK